MSTSTVEDERGAGDEPEAMARVQGMIEYLYPRKPYNAWIQGGLRHVAIRVGRGIWIESSSTTWQGAFREIDSQLEVLRASTRTGGR